MAQRINVPENTGLIILSSLTILWNCYYDLFTENMSTEYNRKSNWKKTISSWDYKIKLRTLRRKYKTHGRTKIIVLTMCCQFTSYQFEEILRAFIKTNLSKHASLDYNTKRKWDAVNDVIVISVIYVFVRIFVNICKMLNVSCFCSYNVF